MSGLLGYFRSLRHRVPLSILVTIGAVALGYVMAMRDDMTAMGDVAFVRLFEGVNHGLYAGIMYNPAFLILAYPILVFVGSVPQIVRRGGVSSGIAVATAVAFSVSLLYSALLLACEGVFFWISGVPTLEGGLSVLFFAAEYAGFTLFFMSCALLMLVVYVLGSTRASTAVLVAFAYGLSDYFLAMSPLRGMWFADIGWTNVSAILLSPPDALAAVGRLFGWCGIGLLLLYLASQERDYYRTSVE